MDTDGAEKELDLLTPERVGELFGVTVGTLANWRHAKAGPAWVRIGRLVRYRRAAVVAWLKEQER